MPRFLRNNAHIDPPTSITTKPVTTPPSPAHEILQGYWYEEMQREEERARENNLAAAAAAPHINPYTGLPSWVPGENKWGNVPDDDDDMPFNLF